MSANTYVVSLPPDVQISAVDHLKPLLVAALASAGDVSVHCAQVQRVDCAGLQLLLAGAKAVAANGRRFVLADVTAEMQSCLSVLGAESAFTKS